MKNNNNSVKIDGIDKKRKKKGLEELEIKRWASYCSRASLPSNPLKSLLYSALTHKLDLGKAEIIFKMLPKVARDKLSKTSAGKKKVLNVLARYIYNGGDGAVGAIMKNFLTTKRNFKTIDYMPIYKEGFSHYTPDVFKAEFEEYILKTKSKPIKQVLIN